MKVAYITQKMQNEFVVNENRLNTQGQFSLGMGLSELENAFKENYPVDVLPSVTGDKFMWTEAFVHKCLWAFATDNLDDMGEDEIEMFNKFVEYEERMSFSITNQASDATTIMNRGMRVVNHGVHVGSIATGCTNPDVYGNSYEVLRGQVLLGNKCVMHPIPTRPEDIEMMESLDKLFMDMYNDVPHGIDKIPNGELIDLTNSEFDHVKDIDDAR